MNERRHDPLGDRWVLICEHRWRAPSGKAHAQEGACPFCPGNEAATPPTIALRGSPWHARAFANRAPALRLEAPRQARHEGPYSAAGAFGVHEVLVESAEHRPLSAQPPEQTIEALLLARDRLESLARDSRLGFLTWFRNEGRAAGMSEPHPHAQIVGGAEPGSDETAHRARVAEHHDRTGRSLLGDLVQAELEDGRRLLHTRPSVVAFCPFAPRAAFEVWIAPTFDTSFFALSDSAVSQIGSLLHGVVQAQAAALGTPAYNAAICMAHGPHRPPGYRWLLKVVPRIVPGAAMERIVGLDLVTASPETAARVLRSVAPRAATPAS